MPTFNTATNEAISIATNPTTEVTQHVLDLSLAAASVSWIGSNPSYTSSDSLLNDDGLVTDSEALVALFFSGRGLDIEVADIPPTRAITADES